MAIAALRGISIKKQPPPFGKMTRIHPLYARTLHTPLSSTEFVKMYSLGHKNDVQLVVWLVDWLSIDICPARKYNIHMETLP